MANLDGAGLAILWNRIRGLIRHVLGGAFGHPDRIVITDGNGALSVMDGFRTNITSQVLYETDASNPDELFELGVDDVHLLLLMVEETTGETLTDLESLTLITDGVRETLPRHHYDNALTEESCMIFGNARYTGYGTPACQDQADTGETSMVFYMDGMLGLCLPDGASHALWLGHINSCLCVDGTPQEETDLVNLGYFREHIPIVLGTGMGSLRQNLPDAVASGTGSFAGNIGKARGLYAFAANSAEAGGDYAAALGIRTSAGGRGAAAFGYETSASGSGASAAGDSCRAEGRNAHAEGYGTIALGGEQHVIGRFNLPDAAGTYVELVGIGAGNARANGRTLDWNGNEWLAGTLSAAGLILRDESGTPYRLKIRDGALTVTQEND